jgi:hypothetical protein
VNVDPELRKRVERIKSSTVQLYREAGDYSNRELVEGIVVSPDDIAAIEVVARADLVRTLAAAFGLLTTGERDAILAAAHHRMVQPTTTSGGSGDAVVNTTIDANRTWELRCTSSITATLSCRHRASGRDVGLRVSARPPRYRQPVHG